MAKIYKVWIEVELIDEDNDEYINIPLEFDNTREFETEQEAIDYALTLNERERGEMIEKTDATILGIIYHPEIRHVLTEQGKKDIAEMVQTLADGLSNCPFLQCGFAEKCNAMCDWVREQQPKA